VVVFDTTVPGQELAEVGRIDVSAAVGPGPGQTVSLTSQLALTADDGRLFVAYQVVQAGQVVDSGVADLETGSLTVRALIPLRDAVGNLLAAQQGLVAVPPLDTDGDGVPDSIDACPASDTRLTVVIGASDTGVANELGVDGCTTSDRIAVCAATATTHGQFVSCVSHLTDMLAAEGSLTNQERGDIQKAAATANVPATKKQK
jgi:hypothetical protein